MIFIGLLKLTTVVTLSEVLCSESLGRDEAAIWKVRFGFGLLAVLIR